MVRDPNTGEMIRNSNAETLVRQVLIESVGPTIDKQLFSANAARAGPAGLLNGISGLTPTAAGAKGEPLGRALRATSRRGLGEVVGGRTCLLVGVHLPRTRRAITRPTRPILTQSRQSLRGEVAKAQAYNPSTFSRLLRFTLP